MIHRHSIVTACRAAPIIAATWASVAIAADKSAYHLFNATPPPQMRDLSTDRPDTTESPYTVDAGHLQIETSFIEYMRDRSSNRYDVLPTNLKVGLTNSADLQLVIQPYITADEDDRDGSIGGFGDTQLRLKLNLWGNDGGTTAMALMPFIQVPTGESDVGASKVEGGLIVPLGIELPAEFNLTVMVEFDAVRNAEDDGYRLDFVHSATVGREISGPLGGFIEYVGVMPFEDGEDYLAFATTGLTYAVTPDVQLDVAFQFGLVDAADDFNIRTGISLRF